MIDFISGVVLSAGDSGAVVLDCGHFGLEVLLPTGEISGLSIGERSRIYGIVKISVESGAIKAIGSVSRDDRDSMEGLLEIPGIGPKVVLSLFSKLGGEGVRQALVSEDVTALSSVPGLGVKSASKLIISCKGKGFPLAPKDGAGSGKGSVVELGESERSVVSGLVGLGWKEADATARVLEIGSGDGDVAGMMRRALVRQ